MLPEVARKYVVSALAGTPNVLESLLQSVTSGNDPVWDFRPDADRFTLREMLAHLADWEPIWRDRMWRTLQEDTPFLPNMDESQFAIDHNYAHADPHHSLAVIAEERPKLIELLKHLPAEAWERAAMREGIGPMTLEGQVTLVLGHDGYHAQQTADTLKRFAEQNA